MNSEYTPPLELVEISIPDPMETPTPEPDTTETTVPNHGGGDIGTMPDEMPETEILSPNIDPDPVETPEPEPEPVETPTPDSDTTETTVPNHGGGDIGTMPDEMPETEILNPNIDTDPEQGGEWVPPPELDETQIPNQGGGGWIPPIEMPELFIPEFTIHTSPTTPAFSENIADIVLHRKPDHASAESVRVKIKLNGIVLCEDVRLYYNSDGQIAINLKEIVKGVGIKYELPESDTSGLERPIDRIEVVLANWWWITNFITRTYEVIIGGKSTPSTLFDWSRDNWLTWQPQIITMPIHQPQWLSMVMLERVSAWCTIKSRLYFSNGTTLDKTIEEYDCAENEERIIRRNVAFETIWGDECRAQSSRPICYDVFASWDSTPEEKIYTQRYVIRKDNVYDRCFMFQNSLGGFDTIMATGEEIISGDGDVRTFISGDTEHELTNSHTTTVEQNTGYIEDKRMARQWKEFFKSNNRALYRDGAYVKIVVTEYELKHKQGELTSYSFEYRLATKDETTSYERYELPKFNPPHHFYNRRYNNHE